MKQIKKVLAFTLVFVIMATSFAFASEPTIVSPTVDSIVSGDSLLISVKLTDSRSIRVTVIEEMETDSKGKLSAASVESMEKDDITSISAIYDKALVAAAKEAKSKKTETEETTTEAFTFTVKIGKTSKKYTDVTYMESVTYKNKQADEVSFYTKQLSDVEPGLYRVQVDSLDTKGNVVSTQNVFVAVKEKAAKDVATLETQQKGAVKAIQNLLKTIFK